jgi:uncharacterized protein (DUF2126 family)
VANRLSFLIDDPDGAEWNTDALGPTKRRRAASFFTVCANSTRHRARPLRTGEMVSRRAAAALVAQLLLAARRPSLWHDPALFAEESRDYGADEQLAGRFLRRVAERLDLDSEYVFPAFEDAFYYLWRERQLPVNVDPFDARLDDPLERERLARIFTQGMDDRHRARIAGHARVAKGRRWQSGPWFLRGDRCYLIPGDSPVGYRLPLDSQPWVAKADYPYINPPDPTQPFPPLRAYAEIRKQPVTETPAGSDTPMFAGTAFERWPQSKESAGWITRTAMSAQARDGILYIFMPPTGALDDYLELIGAIEATAEELSTPIIIEGYEPPPDPRLVKFSVTPDPGVIEVNVQPCADWDELVERTTHLYETARLSRLTSEKFMLDGRHTGTGGGNHFVLGAATPLDSPFLRRPDLLRSLISYWHNHPSLSYLFSGLFIGPTSQAPRVDEARNDAFMNWNSHSSSFRGGTPSCRPG